jgi:hypothetical protein
MATYKQSSPWYTTTENNLYLELINYRPIASSSDDVKYIIENQYRHRPDLLAFDLYGDSKLWWVFSVRNRSIIKDPIYDFEPGVEIFCPKKENVSKAISSVTKGS